MQRPAYRRQSPAKNRHAPPTPPPQNRRAAAQNSPQTRPAQGERQRLTPAGREAALEWLLPQDSRPPTTEKAWPAPACFTWNTAPGAGQVGTGCWPAGNRLLASAQGALHHPKTQPTHTRGSPSNKCACVRVCALDNAARVLARCGRGAGAVRARGRAGQRARPACSVRRPARPVAMWACAARAAHRPWRADLAGVRFRAPHGRAAPPAPRSFAHGGRWSAATRCAPLPRACATSVQPRTRHRPASAPPELPPPPRGC